MQNTLPLQFDLTKVYSLLQAFDRIGRFMYPDAWTGREAFAAPASEPAEVKAERARLGDEIASRQVDLERLIDFDGFALPEGGQIRLAERQLELTEQITQLREAKDRLQPSYQDREVDRIAFERREAVEGRLADLFATGKLRIVTANNNLVRWGQWRSEPDFRIDYAFSMLFAPRSISRIRKHAAFVFQSEFDAWAKPFELDAQEAGVDERAAEWLTAKVRGTAASPGKVALRDECQKEFPTVSTRRFNAIWDQTVPDAWKRSGRKTAE